MKFVFRIVSLLATLGVGTAFVHTSGSLSSWSSLLRASQKEVPIQLSVPVLRQLELTNAKNVKVKLDQLMGPGKSVVVFLRHLG